MEIYECMVCHQLEDADVIAAEDGCPACGNNMNPESWELVL